MCCSIVFCTLNPALLRNVTHNKLNVNIESLLIMGCNIYNKCALCCVYSSNIFKVCIQDNYNLLKNNPYFQNNFINPYSFLILCEFCLMKLKIFIKCDPKFTTNIMQSSSQDKKEHFEDTNCDCDHCKAKYGNLPLLAEVIEKIQNESNLTTKDENSSSSDKKTTDKPIPSTSKDQTYNKKVLKCNHCDKSFTHKGDFNKHLRKHTGEQPFQCTVCKRKFAHTSNLARHLRVHSGIKPFHCDRCNKNFSRKDKLILHQKTKLCLNAKSANK